MSKQAHGKYIALGSLSGCMLFTLLVSLATPALAGSTNNPPVPQLQGPSNLAVGQSFVVHVSFPKNSAARYYLDLFHCQPGKDARPSNDSNTVPFPGQGCAFWHNGSLNPIHPNTGHMDINIMGPQTGAYGMYNALPRAGRPNLETWLEGIWYIRVRLISAYDVKGQWSHWHRTVIGNGNIVKSVVTMGMTIDQSRGRTSIIMNGLKPPVVILPMEGHVYHGGMIDASGTLPAHARYSEWSCCDIEWQRAVVVTRENNEYVAAHTPPGQIKESVFPSLRSPWHTAIGLNGHAPHQEQAPTFRSGWSFDALRPHSHKFGYQYWFRIRENYLPGHASGPWSAWRSFIVQEPIGSKVRYRGMRVLPAGNPKPVMRSLPGHKPNARKGPLNLPHRTSVGH